MRDRIFIVCGGTSLDLTKIGWLQYEDTIAVNYMGQHMNSPTYFLTADSGVIQRAVDGDFWGLQRKITTTVVVINKEEHPAWDRVASHISKFDRHVIPTRWDGEMVLDGNGFATGKNTGFCALQFAIQLGYKNIYLLGIDLQKVTGRKYCYQKEPGGTNSPYDLFYKHFATGLERSRKAGIKVFSCSVLSRLNNIIPYVPLESLVPKMPIFVSHYTVDTPYVDIVKNLKASLEKWKLDYDLEPIKSLGSWRLNSNYCAKQVQATLQKYSPRSILRLDSDAVVQKYPDLFLQEDFQADIAAVIWEESRLRPRGEFLGGTIYFNNNKRTKIAVDKWVEMCEAKPDFRNGDMLYGIVKNQEGLVFENLPLSYCRIFDFANMGRERVIEHFQASRRCKRIVNIQHAKRG